MQSSKVRRGHENRDHRTLKRETGDILERLGFGLVRCEHQLADVVGTTPQGILAGEVEFSCRNLLVNLERDFARGCRFVLVVCPDFQIAGEVCRKLSRELRDELKWKVGVMTIEALRMLDAGRSEKSCKRIYE